jgi:hypothetical protein
MQDLGYKDTMLSVSTKSTTVFAWSLGVFTQSSKLWALSLEKSA